MADWKETYIDGSSAFRSIKKLFEAKAIDRMYDIKDLHPTKISKAVGINSGRYSYKLANPETFSTFEILRLAYVLNVDPVLIVEVIQKEKAVLEKILVRVNKK